MPLVYILLGALGLSVIALLYGELVGFRTSSTPRVGKKAYPDLWLACLLDCEYSPTKQSYGPARILPATKLKLSSVTKTCDSC